MTFAGREQELHADAAEAPGGCAAPAVDVRVVPVDDPDAAAPIIALLLELLDGPGHSGGG